MRGAAAAVLASIALILGSGCGASDSTSAVNVSRYVEGGDWDGANWMRDLNSVIGDRPLARLRIPGTHDAGTFSIPRRGAVVADAQGDTGTTQFEGVPEDFVLGAQITQDRTFTQQFDDGIRYLDFRLVCDPEGMFIVHTFRGAPVEEALAEIASWSSAHPDEVIFLDVQKNYGCSSQTYVAKGGGAHSGNEAFTELVAIAFGSSLAPRPSSASADTTLNSLVAAKTNVVPFFIDTSFAGSTDMWWLRSSNDLPNGAGMTNIWDPITTMPEMFTFLESEGPKFNSRGSSQLLLASVATSPMFPKETGIAKWYADWKAGAQVGSLREFITKFVLPEMPEMVSSLAGAGYNVLSTDFYELGNWSNGASFAQLVVAQNAHS